MTIKISDEAVKIGAAIYKEALSDRRGFRPDHLGILQDDYIWNEIYEDIGKCALSIAAPFIIADAVREEREACAKLVEATTTAANSKHLSGWGQNTDTVTAMLVERDFEIAAAIRARGEA